MIKLSTIDQHRLDGKEGPALQFAMELLVRVAKATAAERFINVSQAHLVGAYYSGQADLQLIKNLADSGCQVAIPTTLSASSVDLRQSQLYIANSEYFRKSCNIVTLYKQLGCQLELTCAPYHLPMSLQQGDKVAWAESNAVVYANSVVGAYTEKTYQYLDLCAALTGRMPEFGLYLQKNRRASLLIELRDIPHHWLADDSFYQLLGIVVGGISGNDIPAIKGVPATVTEDQLRGLGAAAASAGNLKMFHAIGVTPEAKTLEQAFQNCSADRRIRITPQDIIATKRSLSLADEKNLSAVCLGAPHFSLAEFEYLINLLGGRQVAAGVEFCVSTSRHVMKLLLNSGLSESLASSGIKIVTDTCTYYGDLFRNRSGIIMTASAKWAYYAPGNMGAKVTFSRIEDCVESAVSGRVIEASTFWDVE